MRTDTIRILPVALALALASIAPSAFAADAKDEERRVMSARQVDTTANVSEEMAKIAESKRLEAISRLKDLLGKGVEGDQKAEMMLRLADLYFQQGRFLYLKEMATFDVAYDKCFNTEGCDTDKLKADNAGSREWQEKSIRLYENILTNYPRYARADQATFFLGSALQDVGRREDSVEAFKKLVKLYQDSSYVPDAYVLIGEYYFETNNAYAALRAYLKATSFTASEKYPFAMYKLAWCYYNVGDYTSAIDTMKTVVSYGQGMTAEQKKGVNLEDEALKDLVRFFADAGAMNDAYEYFTKLGKKDLIQAMLARLATTYYEQGKFDQAIETYRRLIAEDPNGAKCPDYQGEIINAFRKMGQRDRTLEEIDRLLRDYGKTSAWARTNASNPNVVADATRRIEENLRRAAVEYHNEAKTLEKGRHKDAGPTYQLARQAYASYLNEFAKDEHAYDVRYAYGELLYHLKDFKGAYDQYMNVVDINPTGKYSKFCAEAAIFAAEEQVKLEGGGDASGKVTASAKDSKKEALPLTDWEQKLVDACRKYAELFPNDTKVRNVIYKSAYLLYNKYRFEDAATQFRVVIKMEPSSKEAETAAELILDSFVIREDWKNLKENAKFYYDQEGLGSAKFKTETYGVYQRSSFKLIETEFDKDKDKGKAADAFVAFYGEFPEADTAAQALNNASIYYYDTSRLADAMKVRHILIDDPKFGPKVKYYYDQIGALGYDYESIANFERSAFYYEKLWALFPEESKKLGKDKPDELAKMSGKAADAIYSAAVFRNAMGEWEAAIANYGQFITAFASDPRSTETKITIARIYEDHGRPDEAGAAFMAFYTKPPAGAPEELLYFSRLHHGRVLTADGEKAKADKLYADTVAMWKKAGQPKGPPTEFVAEMMYVLAQPTLGKYMELKIKGAGKAAGKKAEDKALIDSLGAKSKALLGTQVAFTEIVGTGAGEWGLASLVALGKAYENMADTLRTGAVPFYLTDDQIEIYQMGIEDKAYTQIEKAVEAYKLALEKSFELTLYNENTAYATRQLGVLRPQEYPGLNEVLVEGRYTSQKVRNFEPEQGL